MNKEMINKLLSSPIWADNLIAFHLLKGVRYDDLDDILVKEGLNRTSEYKIYLRKCRHSDSLQNIQISEDVILYTGSSAILFIPRSWYKNKERKFESL